MIEPHSEAGSEAGWLSRRIAESGHPWGYDAFLEAALYDPDHGFYGSGRGRAGRRGDFLTSVEVGPLFGAVLARALDTWWAALGRPEPFTVIEAGAGVGTLARGVLAAQPACRPRYIAVERSAALRALHPEGVESVANLPEEPVGMGVVLANELLDNLPFSLCERTSDGWREIQIDENGADVFADIVELDLPGLLGAATGARVPRQRAAARWVEDARAVLDRGLVVAFDYAVADTASLAERPWTEWLRTYRGQQRGGHPADGAGEQDVTTEVALDQLPPAGRVVSQRHFLVEHGIDDLVAEGRKVWAERAHLGDLAALKARSRVREAEALLDPGGLGGFSVASWLVRYPASHRY